MAEVWSWLDTVPDPEIPVISIVDLGIVRDVVWADETLEITVTPTYSGCPATRVINQDIEAALQERGLADIRLKQQLSPAWTTDWMTEKGRAALEDYGIAAPQPTGRPNACPQCKSDDLERLSQFGATPCKALWRCKACGEPFDYFKCI